MLERGADPNIYNDEQITPLRVAAAKGFAEICEILIQYGADVEVEDIDGYSALKVSAYYGHLATVKVLVEIGGAEVGQPSKLFGDSAYKIALERNHHDVAAYFRGIWQKAQDDKSEKPEPSSTNTLRPTIIFNIFFIIFHFVRNIKVR